METKPIKLTRPVATQLIRRALGTDASVELSPGCPSDEKIYLGYTPMLEVECSVNRDWDLFELNIAPMGGIGTIHMLFDPNTLQRNACAESDIRYSSRMNAVDWWLLTNEPDTVRERYQKLRGEPL